MYRREQRQRNQVNGCRVRVADFFNAVKRELGVLPFIAEDLGLITPDVSALRDEFQIPGTRVLQFAFDGSANNPYLPHNYVSNTVVYTGTHDNPPSREWYEELPPYQQENFLPLSEHTTTRQSRGCLELDAPCVVVESCTGDRSLARLA